MGNNINLQNPTKNISHHQDSLVNKELNSEAKAAESSKGEIDGTKGNPEEITSETINKFLDDFIRAELPSNRNNRHLKTGNTQEEHFI